MFRPKRLKKIERLKKALAETPSDSITVLPLGKIIFNRKYFYFSSCMIMS